MSIYGRDPNGIQPPRTTAREAEVKAILDAVNRALHHEGVPDRQRIRIMNRLTYGQPDGADAYYRWPRLGDSPASDTYDADQFQRLHTGQWLDV